MGTMAETFGGSSGRKHSYQGPLSPSGLMGFFDPAVGSGRLPADAINTAARSASQNLSAILIRRLPTGTTAEAVRTMLLFAKDLAGVELVPRSFAEEQSFAAAIACFRTLDAAVEARDMLNGKTNSAGDSLMIVEVLGTSPNGSWVRRSPFDQALPRLEHRSSESLAASAGTTAGPATSVSAVASSSNSNSTGTIGMGIGSNVKANGGGNGSGGGNGGGLNRPSSKFNFSGLDRVTPPQLSSTFSSGDSSTGEASPYSKLFSPQSPIGHPLERQRISGKSVIGEDGVDDDTGKLLNDPAGYAAQNDFAGTTGSGPTGRRSTLPQLPSRAFSNLSLSNSSLASPPSSVLISPRSGGGLQSPSAFSQPGMPFGPIGTGSSVAGGPANGNGSGGSGSQGNGSGGLKSPYSLAGQHFVAPNFPPVNPADQNPPCNTLYVGNLPVDTSEDELKSIFSKQRGYKRLCFRTKANGPMCFVEFEDISFATKALQQLYGWPLSNSVKGGIRLSFSKNPLGVRNGQPPNGSTGGASPGINVNGLGGSSGLPSPMSPHGPAGGMSGMQQFAGFNGPPPGIPAPPGLINTAAAGHGHGHGLASPVGGAFSGPTSPAAGVSMSGLRSPTSQGTPGSWGLPSATSGQSGFGDYGSAR